MKIGDGETNVNQLPFLNEDSVSYTQQSLNDQQKLQARTNIDAVSLKEVEEMLGIEEEFSETGNPLILNLEKEKEIEVISKISRQESSPYYESTKLTLHWANSEAIINAVSMYGGSGTVIEKNGLTMTINDDGTATFKGTSTASTLFDAAIPKPKVIYPAGSYFIPSAGMMMQPFDLKGGSLGNKWGKKTITIDQSFILNRIFIEYKADQTVDETKQINISLANIESNSGNSYAQTEYTIDFGKVVTEGEYNWTTGELKDADGNTVSYHGGQQIIGTAGKNVFWTGFGEVTASNKVNNLEKVVIQLNEAAPDETISSICDFYFRPTTPEAAYGLFQSSFTNNGDFHGNEVPVITTKGTLSVKDADSNIKYSKYINPIFNTRGISDVLSHNGLDKKWSEKFYLNKAPVSTTSSPSTSPNARDAYIFVWEFDESEFVNTGIPAKIHDIPMASPCFINNDNSEKNVNNQNMFGATPYPAFFSYNEESDKYTLTVRGIEAWSIEQQLTQYSKVYFYYQLETPYNQSFTFAMGIDAGDVVSFEADLADAQPYIDKEGILQTSSGNVTELNVNPTLTVFIPRNVEDAMDGMANAAIILNRGAQNAGGDATVQGYSWIGEGDGVTDYTTIIQNKLDVIHSVSNGGTIYLGPGTYKISSNLFVYENTRIIGDGQTVIEQTANNTHAFVLCGSGITFEDLSIKLSGECTEVTACVYINSYNKPSTNGYNSNFPETNYVQRLTIDNVFMSGEYKFGRENDYPVVSDAYENYKGVGIYGRRLFFNYAHVDNVHFKYLYSGVYGGGGSNYYNITSEFNKYGLYIITAGDNTYFVDGHPQYAIDINGNYITMSEAIAYVESDSMSTYHLRTFDTQAYKMIAFFDGYTSSNKIDIQYNQSTQHSLWFSHKWNVLKWMVVDYGRGNICSDQFKNTPFHIGSATEAISRGPQLELPNPVIQNALSGAGIWGEISSNVEFSEFGISLRDVCRYPSEKTVFSHNLPYIVSNAPPSVDNPIEIVIDFSNRPVIGHPNYFIQFYHEYIASDYTVSFDTTNTGVFNEEFVIPVTGNTNITEYFDYPQIGRTYTTYRMKISFTKPLQITDLHEALNNNVFDYNPEGLIGICNIGMTVNDYAGRSFLGECGGSLYGNVDMHQNTLKNLPTPIDDGDAVNKAYLEEKLVNNDSSILIVTSYHDEEYGDIASHGPYEIYEAVNNNKLAYLLYKDLVFTCTHVGEGEEAEFRTVDNENYKRIVHIGEYLKNDSEDEYYYSISEGDIGAYGKILFDYDLNDYHEEQLNRMLENGFYIQQEVDGEQKIIRNTPTYDELPQKIADAIHKEYDDGNGYLLETLDMVAWGAGYNATDSYLGEYGFTDIDEDGNPFRNVPTYEEVQNSINEITPGLIGAAYGEFLCIELTEEDGVLYANLAPSTIFDIISTNVAAYLHVDGNLLPCVYFNYEIAKFYDINTHNVYSISNEEAVVTVEDFTPLTPLIVTSSNNISNYSSQEIFEAAQAGRPVYLKMWSGTYLKLSWVNGTEATFDYPGTQSIISSDGSSHNTHTFRTVVIQNNDVFYKSIPMASQSYVDAQIGNIESVLDSIITLQTSLIGGNE